MHNILDRRATHKVWHYCIRNLAFWQINSTDRGCGRNMMMLVMAQSSTAQHTDAAPSPCRSNVRVAGLAQDQRTRQSLLALPVTPALPQWPNGDGDSVVGASLEKPHRAALSTI